jgi:hypothetical protein
MQSHQKFTSDWRLLRLFATRQKFATPASAETAVAMDGRNGLQFTVKDPEGTITTRAQPTLPNKI